MYGNDIECLVSVQCTEICHECNELKPICICMIYLKRPSSWTAYQKKT